MFPSTTSLQRSTTMVSKLVRLALGKERNICCSFRAIATSAREWRDKDDVAFRLDPDIPTELRDFSAFRHLQRPSAGFATSTLTGLKPRPISPRAGLSFPIRQFSTTNESRGSDKSDGGDKGDGSGSGKAGEYIVGRKEGIGFLVFGILIFIVRAFAPSYDSSLYGLGVGFVFFGLTFIILSFLV